MGDLNLANLIRIEMDRRNLSLRDFAKLSGTTHPTIRLILDGEKPSFDTCEKLAPVLHMSIESVLRAAGLLPQVTLDQATLDEIENVLSHLPPEKYAEFIQHGWVMVHNARKPDNQ
jgi:transcriptional regulator with XRE-family HTH domain